MKRAPKSAPAPTASASVASIAEQLAARAYRLPGTPTIKVETSAQLGFCIRVLLEGPTYEGQTPDDMRANDWWIRAKECEVGEVFEPGEKVEPAAWELQIAKEMDLYGSDTTKELARAFTRLVSIEEIRSLFVGVNLLRERMQAAGLPV